MKATIKSVLNKAVEALEEDDYKAIWDAAFDLVECVVSVTPTKIDDIMVMPIIRIIRRRYNIED